MIKIINRFNGMIHKIKYEFNNKWQPNNYKKYNSQNFNNSQLVSEIQFRNYNICIMKNDYDIYLFPFHPNISKKTANSYQVKKNSNVLALTFVQKNENISEQIRWQNRKSFTFKFPDLSKLIYVQPGKQKQSRIISSRKQSQNTSYDKQLIIKDNIQKQQIQLTLKNNKKQIIDGRININQIQKTLQININYQQYRLFYELIKNSLFQLSGWKFQIQLQRQQYFNKIFNKNNSDQSLDNNFQKKVIKNYSQQYKTFDNN